MTIILFLVDTSASMAQRNYMGCSAIDTAKTIVQDILKLRQRDINNRQTDRYMLFSTEEFPGCVKAGWKEGSGIFHEQLKALRPCGKSPLKQALLSALHFINLNRANTGVDYYGHGRFPHLQESVIIVMISDGAGIAELPSDFELRADPKHPTPGTEYTEEAFRWDQRIYSIVLRMSARSPAEPRIAAAAAVTAEPGVIQRVCEATGGRSFTMTSHKQQSMMIDTLTQSIQVNGIVLRFEYPAPVLMPFNGEVTQERQAELEGEALKQALESRLAVALQAHPLTFVLTRNRAPGHWPIPEAFWPEAVQSSIKLPVRKAHPMLTIGLNATEAQVNTEFPFDKYELESNCALSEFVRDRTTSLKNANLCWQVYVNNSYMSPGLGKPFGFIKTATTGSSVNLFLMPYNYPVLLRLLDEQKADARLRAHPDWRHKLDQYVRSCPSYYRQTLKKALNRIKVTGGALDDPPPYNPHLYAPQLNKALTTVKTVGKEELDKLLAEIGSRLSRPPTLPAQLYRVNVEIRERLRPARNFRIEWEEERRARLAAAKADEPEPQKKKHRGRIPLPSTPRASTVVIEDDIGPDPELPEPAAAAPEPIPNLTMELFAQAGMSKVYTNPFHIERSQLAEMLPRLRINLEQQIRDSPIPALEGGLPGMSCKLQTAYELHSQFVAQMGNYDEYVKALEAIGAGPLREVEHRAMRENTFGNPFKKDKKSLAVDEVGEAPAAARETTTGMSKKDRRAMEGNRPPRRKAGPLALNSMQVWRDRRRTNSLSTVSDLSHTAEDLTDDISEAEMSAAAGSSDVDEIADDLASMGGSSSSSPTARAGNGAAIEGRRAASPTPSTVSKEEDDDDDDVAILETPTPAKKPRLSDASSSRAEGGGPTRAATSSAVPHPQRRPRKGGEEATLERVRDLKGEVVRVVRMFLSDEAMFSKIEALLAPLSMRTLVLMTRFARDEAKRFKKRALTTTLQQRLDELETVASAII